MNQIAQKPVHL